MTMRWSLQDLTCCELELSAGDGASLRWFLLLGWIDDRPAIAEWDGVRLLVSRNLLDVGSLAVEVDGAFADCEPSGCHHYASLTDTPERALITLAECCDGIGVVETVDDKGRRSW
jgi:hypothetical protein